MYTSQRKTAGQRKLFFSSAIAVALMVILSGLVCRSQGTKIPPITPPPQPTPKPRPAPTPKKPTVVATSDNTGAAVAPGGAGGSYSGSHLGAPDWELRNPDPQRWTLHPKKGSLLIQTPNGSLSDSKSLKNWLIFNKALPADDFEIIVEASIQMQGAGNYVAIALFADDQNYLFVDFQGDDVCGIRRTPYFSKVFQGKATSLAGEQRCGGVAAQPERIFLKIERQEDTYSGFYAYEDQPTTVDQIKWGRIGSLPWINFHGKLVLLAANYREAPEVAAEFYSVLIRKK